MTHQELAPAHWYPQFVDYLAFSFNTATTFGPADAPAIKRWAKPCGSRLGHRNFVSVANVR